MNRRGFLRSICALATAPVAAKLLPLALVQKAEAVQIERAFPSAALTAAYNRAFMGYLYANLNKMEMCTRIAIPEKGGQIFRNFITIPLGPEAAQVQYNS